MTGQLINFVRPVTDQLESLQNQCEQLAALHDEAHRRLRLQGEWLTNAGGIDAFVGDGATEFSSAIEFYISISEKHMQLLDEVSGAARICASEMIEAAVIASSASLNEEMVAHVLVQLTHENLIREGGEAVVTIINEMRRTLENMRISGGNFFGHVFQGHYGSALHDASQELAYAIRLYNEAGSLLRDVERVLYNWGQSTGNAVNLFLNKIGRAADYSGTLLGIVTSSIEQFKPILKTLPEFKDLIPWLDSAVGKITLLGVGSVLDFISEKEHTVRNFVGDLLGGGIGYAVGLTPPGRAVIIIFGVIHLGGAGLAWGQNKLGDTYGGKIGEELKKPAGDLYTVSENANPGAVFDDIGKTIVDTEGFGTLLAPTFFALNTVGDALGVKVSEPDQIPSDMKKTLSDLWKLGTPVPQFIVLVKAVNLEDQAAVENVVIQNLPFLSKDFKHTWSVGTVERMWSFILHYRERRNYHQWRRYRRCWI
jgi:hypothetical protein